MVVSGLCAASEFTRQFWSSRRQRCRRQSNGSRAPCKTCQNQRDISQLPWIGSVPVLGALFTSKSFLAYPVFTLTPNM
jgi:hypothetical protein